MNVTPEDFQARLGDGTDVSSTRGEQLTNGVEKLSVRDDVGEDWGRNNSLTCKS